MANVLPMEQRVAVVAHLVEGASVRGTSRLTGVSQPAILSLLLRMGEGCARLHDRMVRDIDVRDVQADEIWSYVQKKQARVTPEDPAEWGDAYAFVAMARTCKLVISYRVGKRDEANTQAFIADLRARLVTVPLLCTDGFQPYAEAVGEHFQGAVDYGVVHKDYRKGRQHDGQPSDHRYAPPRHAFITRIPRMGSPEMSRISTSHIERQNLTMRMQIRRLTRLCNGFSKKLDNHRAAISLHMGFYNLCRVHEALRVTPAMEAGITRHVWSIQELVQAALSEPAAPPPDPRPLKLPEPPEGAQTPAARPLPNGRGWLRVVGEGKVGSTSTASTRTAPTPSPKAGPQSPKPKPTQLRLFDD
ncbi:transposase [Chondromyces apiculatus]|nr:transposase [Chondromyces apiculatus]